MAEQDFDVIIIGGGLAGLTSAIHLSKHNIKVLLVEKTNYPSHKVCGEYISKEVLPYLKQLGLNPFDLGAKNIDEFELTTHNNKHIRAKLPLGGFGLSRFEMDFQLYKLAKANGATIVQDTITNVNFKTDGFQVKSKTDKNFKAKIVIGSYGKRSNLDVQLQRAFIQKKSPYLAVKVHAKGDFPENKVALHNFKGGYCGVSKVENDHINLCYITNFDAFKAYKNIDAFQEEIVFKNKALRKIFEDSNITFKNPLTISQISFETKSPVENHILMCGDSAGMIHPLCGNGMAMAIKSAQLVSELIIDYLQGKIETRQKLEQLYTRTWKRNFSFRLSVGHTIAYLFRKEWLAPKLLTVLRRFPFLVPLIIKMTHGKPMKAE